MFDAVYLACCALAWLIVGYKVRAWLRDRKNLDLGLLCVMTAAIATVFLFSAPSVYRWFDRLTGVPNLSIVVIYSAVVAFACGAWVLLLHWTGRGHETPRARTVAASWLVVISIAAAWTVALVCFAVGRPDAVEHPRDFSTAYPSEPGITVFLMLYLAIFGISLAVLGHLCRRFATALGGNWLARGLRVVGAGSWLGLAYCAFKLIGLAGARLGRDVYTLCNSVAPICASVAALMVIGGFAIPAFGPRVSAWRRLRRLAPLWRDVTSRVPEVTMEQSRWASWFPLADLEWRANRQMAEIRDVQRGIRRHVDAAVIDIARERARSAALDAEHAAAVVEAAALRRGLSNQATGYLPPYDADSAVMTVSTELTQEHAHLLRVAAVYRLPLVDDVLAAVEGYRRTCVQP